MSQALAWTFWCAKQAHFRSCLLSYQRNCVVESARAALSFTPNAEKDASDQWRCAHCMTDTIRQLTSGSVDHALGRPRARRSHEEGPALASPTIPRSMGVPCPQSCQGRNDTGGLISWPPFGSHLMQHRGRARAGLLNLPIHDVGRDHVVRLSPLDWSRDWVAAAEGGWRRSALARKSDRLRSLALRLP